MTLLECSFGIAICRNQFILSSARGERIGNVFKKAKTIPFRPRLLNSKKKNKFVRTFCTRTSFLNWDNSKFFFYLLYR